MIRPIKRLGQNFLRDPNTIRRIVDSLSAGEGDPVVEIGPGTGALTHELVKRYPSLTAIEVDSRAADLIRTELPAVDVREMDVLAMDWAGLREELGGDRLTVIGNLPYYITSQILFGLIDAAPAIREAVVMMQFEVASRLIAKPRTKAYGILSAQIQLAAEPSILFPVSRNVFHPKPDVRSAMVRLTFPETPSLSADQAVLVRKVIRTAFNQRRKTLRNSLSSILDETASILPESWAGKRAEELAPHDFVHLADYLRGDASALG